MSNEEKMFELMEKIYVEVQTTKKELKSDMKKIESKVDRLELEQRKQGLALEKVQKDIQILSEVMEANYKLTKLQYDDLKEETIEKIETIESVLKIVK